MASLIPFAPEVPSRSTNPFDNIPTAQVVDVETFTRQKKQEIKNCMEECNRLKDELSDLKNLCTLGGECVWNRNWLGSHGTKTCGKCGRMEIEMIKGGRRRRKSKKKKTKRRRRRKKKKTKSRKQGGTRSSKRKTKRKYRKQGGYQSSRRRALRIKKQNKRNVTTTKQQQQQQLLLEEDSTKRLLEEIKSSLKLNEYDFSLSSPDDIGKPSGVGVIYAKKMENGKVRVFTAEEDRTPIHMGPLKDPNKELVFNEHNLDVAYGYKAKKEAERLFTLLNPYRYKRVGLRESVDDGDALTPLDKCLSEELQQSLKIPNPHRSPDFYLGRRSIDKTKKLKVSWQPWFIVFDDETMPDRKAADKRKRADIWSAKKFKFPKKNLENLINDGSIDLYREFWEDDGEKYALKNPYQEVEVDHDENGNVAASHFKTQAGAKKYLVDYLVKVHSAKTSRTSEALTPDGTETRKVKTFANFGLGRWGEEGLLKNWSEIMHLINTKASPNNNYGE